MGNPRRQTKKAPKPSINAVIPLPALQYTVVTNINPIHHTALMGASGTQRMELARGGSIHQNRVERGHAGVGGDKWVQGQPDGTVIILQGRVFTQSDPQYSRPGPRQSSVKYSVSSCRVSRQVK